VTFAVFLHPRAARELGKLEKTIQAGIVKRAGELKEKPDKIGKRLEPSDFWSLRIGDYRAIYQIDRAKKQVAVLFVGYRSRVYGDFSKML
jgi:mRNA-degrading endonuclease RelE of RelBE toxin-antitoxin system